MGRGALPWRGTSWDAGMGRGRLGGAGCCGGSSGVVLAVGFLSWVTHGWERKGCLWEPGSLGDKQWWPAWP